MPARIPKGLVELTKSRAALFNKLKHSDLKFQDFQLSDGNTIKVCKAVQVEDDMGIPYYLPVTAKETFDFAKAYGYFPLTRAVADQIMNKATFLAYRWQPELPDFEKYTDFLSSNSYDGISKFGAHKLWVLSKRRGVKSKKSVNYGFYELSANQAKGTLERGGAFLNKKIYNPKQGLGGAHDDNHWDYSQLLQLMYAESPLTIDGESLSLRMALTAGKSVVSDEGAYSSDDLP